MTLLSLYRVLEFPGKLNLATITSPGVDISKILIELMAFMPFFIRELQKFTSRPVTSVAYAKQVYPLSQDVKSLAEVLVSLLLPATPFHIRKSAPLSGEISKVRGLDTEVQTYSSTSLTGLVESAYAIKKSEI
jgi:hypothetical protein